jgi:pyruvate kinase
MINQINYLNLKFKINIQTILELRGRKIIAELNTQTIKTLNNKEFKIKSDLQNITKNNKFFKNDNEIVSIILKKGDKLIITNHSTQFNKEKHSSFLYYEILIKYMNLNKLLKIGDRIIVNDNKCSFKVENICELLCGKEEDNIVSMSSENPENVKLVLDKLEKLTIDDLKTSTKICEQKSSFLLKKLNERNQSDFDTSFQKIRRIGSPRDKLSSLFKERKYHIICSVEYDCTLNKNFYLYFPTLNFKQHQVDVLSPREVAEISTLESLNVNFININICNQKDIQSIKSILSEDSKLKILASITEIDSLEDFESILNFADGIVLSRTFQMINNKNIKKVRLIINSKRNFAFTI